MSIRRTLLGLLMFVDNVGHLAHMHARDSSFALVSRAPWKQIAPFKERTSPYGRQEEWEDSPEGWPQTAP